jgi:hypothetical protein
MSTFPGGFVPVAPPADGLRLAFVAARRRRNRKAGTTGVAGLLAAVAVIASTGGGADRTLLQQEPLPPSSTSGLGVVTGAGEASAAPASGAQSSTITQVAGTAGAGGQASTSAAGQSVRTNGEGVTTTSRRRVGASGTKAVSGPMTRGSGLLYTGGDVTCPARKQQERQRGLCTDVYAGTSSTPNSMSIQAEICNVGTATEILSYATARELDLTVRHAGLEVWRWSLGRHFAATPHDLTVGTQECITWTTEWAQVDSHGVPVKAGSYEVVADFDADEVAAADRHPSYPITVQPQS